ncbi:PAS domain-containing sensor histidine kinase [Methylocapsa acidiphila]|uniref:sensor histidine kinase n=1 Tax=Methylocapsa acidiphila TaxID=133552 RepID=UPI000A024E94|nr:PAS domain-containing sensor histidine kinase [Methylocapsa acidiphila]
MGRHSGRKHIERQSPLSSASARLVSIDGRPEVRRLARTISLALGFRFIGAMTPIALLCRQPALAATETGALFRSNDVGTISLIFGLGLVSTLTALVYLVGRRRWIRRQAALEREIAALRAKLDRAELLFAAEAQIVMAWAGSDADPAVEGDFSLVAAGSSPRRITAFGSWLPPEQAQSIETCVSRLRECGEAFRRAVVGLSGRHLEVEGRPINGLAVMRIRDVSQERQEIVGLHDLHARTLGELQALWTLLDAIPNPAWVRDAEGRLSWVNAAYARAVETRDPAAAVAGGVELLESPARDASADARASGAVWRGRAPAVVVGERRVFDIVDAPAGGASVGMAMDISDIEAMRAALDRERQAHAGTLDQLSTAVVIFDRAKRLVFHNAAYRQLWGLDAAWLEQRPTDSEIIDRLRAAGLLPEQADFRTWKASLLAAYQSLETEEQAWYLPDGRTLRIVINPNPQGGVTYLFDDVTERFHLESQFNALIRVQGETLDALKEGVAVFGSDGRLKLYNPAFMRMWTLDPAQVEDRPHIDRVARVCAPGFSDEGAWGELRAVVAGLQDLRVGFERRLSRLDGSVFDCAAAPLPDGATLLTFTDATAGVNVERALMERNQALLDAEKLRNDFVHHVSYELRSPLTNIIGFIQLLGDPAVGPLNAKQLEYAGYVMKSSSALLAIINDILDLASIDADAMELSLEEVDIAQTMQAAAEGVQDRLDDSDLTLRVVAPDGLGSFVADRTRIRQILFNLLSNAIGFSAPGQMVELAAARKGGEVIFKVSDRGRGIPAELIEHVFERFKTHTAGSRHRGVGLGLSIVRSFVELHGGVIVIDSVLGEGTTVACIFPSEGVKLEPLQSA